MLKVKRVIQRTYEQMCLDKLKELGKSTASEWASAMGYETHNALAKVIRRIVKDTPEKLIVNCNRKPRYYQAI